MKNKTKKTILLTWWTGFLGSYLITELLNEYNIILLKRRYSDISRISWLINKIKYYDLDYLDKLEKIFEEDNIDMIIHTATDYWKKQSNFNSIIESNLLFPIKLLELWIKHWIKTFINTDTHWNENTELPIWLSYYAYSKKDFIKYLKKIINNNKIKFINIKLEHLYWPKDNNDKFIPYIINNLLQNVDKIDLTKWEQKKDFIYINDAIKAYISILNNIDKILDWFEEFNLWSWKTLSIKELILKINHIIKSNTSLNFGKLEYRKWEPIQSKAYIKKLNNFWWYPKYDINSWILETINYFKSL